MLDDVACGRSVGAVAHLRGDCFWPGRGGSRKTASRAAPAFAEELGGELEDAACVGDDLDGFDAGDLIEEPAAAGVHELGVAFQLEEFEGERRARFRRVSSRMACLSSEEFDDGRRESGRGRPGCRRRGWSRDRGRKARRAVRLGARWRRGGSRGHLARGPRHS